MGVSDSLLTTLCGITDSLVPSISFLGVLPKSIDWVVFSLHGRFGKDKVVELESSCSISVLVCELTENKTIMFFWEKFSVYDLTLFICVWLALVLLFKILLILFIFRF